MEIIERIKIIISNLPPFYKILGTLATIASLMIYLIGMPFQIYMNWQRSSTEGVSAPLILIATIAAFFWALYGWTKRDPYLKITQTIAFLITLILFLQILYY